MSEIRVNNLVSAGGLSAPSMPYGVNFPVGYGLTGAGGIDITGIITAAAYDGTVNTGAAGTFGGILKVTDTTDSTSSSTGCLIIDGGLGIAKNVFIGAGLSVAGTLTYEDATNIDSVGLITAQSGIRVPGGEVTVGVAFSVGHAGVATAAGFVGPLTGAVTGDLTGAATQVTVADESSDTTCFPTFVTAATGNLPPKSGSNLTFNSSTGLLSATLLGGTVNTAAQTNITSVGSLTALTVTGDLTFDNGTNAGKDVEWDVSQNAMIFNDDVYVSLGSDQDFKLWHDGSHAYLRNTTGTLYIQPKNGENAVTAVPDGAVSLAYNNSTKLDTTNDGVSITGMTTTSAGMTFNGMLKEEVNITAGKLSANTNIDIADGMIHFFTTTETATSTPNFRFNSSYSLQNKMAIGQAISVSVITTAAAAAYSANWTVDGDAVSEQWNGGSAPSEGGSDGYDLYSFTIIKTANATGDSGFKVFGNLSNFT